MWKNILDENPLRFNLNELCLWITVRCSMQLSRKWVLPHWIRLYLPASDTRVKTLRAPFLHHPPPPSVDLTSPKVTENNDITIILHWMGLNVSLHALGLRVGYRLVCVGGGGGPGWVCVCSCGGGEGTAKFLGGKKFLSSNRGAKTFQTHEGEGVKKKLDLKSHNFFRNSPRAMSPQTPTEVYGVLDLYRPIGLLVYSSAMPNLTISNNKMISCKV